MMLLFVIINYMYFFFKALTKFAFQLFNGIGDFITIRDVLNPGELPNWDKMTKDEILAKVCKSENQPFGWVTLSVLLKFWRTPFSFSLHGELSTFLTTHEPFLKLLTVMGIISSEGCQLPKSSDIENWEKEIDDIKMFITRNTRILFHKAHL